MARSLFRDGVVTQYLTDGGLYVTDIEGTTGTDEKSSNAHAIRLIRNSIRCFARICSDVAIDGIHQAGQAIFIPAGSPTYSEGSAPYDITMVNIDTSLIDGLAGRRIEPSDWSVSIRPSLSKLVRVARSMVMDPDLVGDSMLSESLNLAIATAVLRDIAPTLIEPMDDGLSRKRYARVVEYVEANLTRPMALNELAGAAGMSRFSFARSFRRATGKTPMRYVMERRIECARRMLTRTKEPISHVAFACGFASQSHMTTTFKSITGKTPAAIRKTYWIVAGMLGSVTSREYMLDLIDASDLIF